MMAEPPKLREEVSHVSDEQQRDAAPSETTAALAGAAKRVIERLALSPLAPGLHIVATPIGNLADITLRALSVLARADIIYCEDTRHSIRLLQHYALNRPLAPYHEHNAEHERPRIIERLERGQVVALISDAGTPLISDPGYKLVRAVIDHYRRTGFSRMSLGAGAGAFGTGESGLTAFKRGFASGSLMTYLCGHIIHAGGYAALSAAMPGSQVEYFPAYRTGEFD